MNAFKQLVISSIFFGSAAAIAQEGTQQFTETKHLSSRARAEVIAELNSARAQGLLEQRGQTYGGFGTNTFGSTGSRAAVVSELNAARAAGELEQRGQTYGSFDARAIASTRSRAEVIAELRQVQASGRRPGQGDRM
jgi:hypothetical protein